MLIEASAMKVRQNLGELINQVQYRNAEVEITRSDKPVAALISIELFDKIQLMRKEFDILTSNLQKSFKGEDQKEVEELINEALKRSRK
jgi:prevent-host-death family protein